MTCWASSLCKFLRHAWSAARCTPYRWYTGMFFLHLPTSRLMQLKRRFFHTLPLRVFGHFVGWSRVTLGLGTPVFWWNNNRLSFLRLDAACATLEAWNTVAVMTTGGGGTFLGLQVLDFACFSQTMSTEWCTHCCAM
jgi:hypothetical protein